MPKTSNFWLSSALEKITAVRDKTSQWCLSVVRRQLMTRGDPKYLGLSGHFLPSRMTAECQTERGVEFPEPLNCAIKGMGLETDGELYLNGGLMNHLARYRVDGTRETIRRPV